MKFWKLFPPFLCFGWLAGAVSAWGQGTIEVSRITFDGSPLQPPGSAYFVQRYDESGVIFQSIATGGFTRVGNNPPSALPDDGSAYLQALVGDSLTFAFTDGRLFNLNSVDLAEYSTVVPGAVTVQFVGYREDGSVVMQDFTTDGVIDGTGPLPDFQTFQFSGNFTGLTRVEIPTYGWSLDNLVVASVPEPRTCALLLLGGLALLAHGRKRNGGGNF